MVLFLLALPVLGACGARPRCEAYHFHPTFPDASREAARAATAAWAGFSGTPVTVNAGDSEEVACSFRAVASGSQEYADLKSAMDGQDFFAAHVDTDGSIAVAFGQWPADDYAVQDPEAFATFVIMHEMAHEYGMMHVADPDAVMGTSNPKPRTAFNASDRAEYLRSR